MQIVVRQISGLGNQLFQYAAGRYYARRYGASMRLAVDPPARAVSYQYARPFLLSHFRIAAPVAVLSRMERAMLIRRDSMRPAVAAVNRMLGVQVIREPIHQRHAFVRDLPVESWARTLYLAGYWQAHELVDSIAGELREELQFREPATGKNAEMLQRILECETPVSLHVRRGDYTLAAEGNIALPLSYYRDAVAALRETVADPTFFVFSDDIAFARANLPAEWKTVFVDHNDDASSYEDLRLMSACHHHILANSSFSWWGAWLNARPEKTVLAPRYWHLHAQSDYPGLLSPGWRRIAFPPRGTAPDSL